MVISLEVLQKDKIRKRKTQIFFIGDLSRANLEPPDFKSLETRFAKNAY